MIQQTTQTMIQQAIQTMRKQILSLALMACSMMATAQWTTDTEANTLVSSLSSDDMKAIGASDGSTYVVFWHSVGAPENYELRLQVLNSAGEQMLGDQGVLVSDDLPMSTYTVLWNVVVDQQDNLYIGATGTGGGDPAFVFKMDLQGNRLWGPTGLSVGSGNAVKILPLAQGNVLVSWWASSGVAQIQQYDASGQAVWGAPQSVTLGSSSTVVGNMFELADGEFIVVFHKVLTGINSFLHAQRFDTSGTPVWTAPIQISDQATAFNRDYQGIIIDDKVYMGYFASSATRFDTFLQCIAPDGTMPWGVNGSSFDTTQAFYEMSPYMGYKPGADDIWMSSTYTNSSQSEKGTYLQRFDRSTGDRLMGDGAFELYPVGSESVPVGGMNIADQGPILLIKEGVDNGASPTVLRATYLDENGQTVWPEGLIDVATFQANKGRIHHTRMVNNQSVAVFVEQKAGPAKVYAQNIVDGEVVLSQNDFDSAIDMTFLNPFSKQISATGSDLDTLAVEVFDALGRRIIAQAKYAKLDQYNVSGWARGLYYFKVTDHKGNQRVYRLIKQ